VRSISGFIVDCALAPRDSVAGLAPGSRELKARISIALDFHKWGQVPYDAGFLFWSRRRAAPRGVRRACGCLRWRREGLAAGSPWPCDLGPEPVSRFSEGAQTWFTLKTYGVEKLGAVIARTCALALSLEALLLATAAGTAGAVQLHTLFAFGYPRR